MSPALIFDLDGTLVDTAPDILGALNAVLVGEGRRPMERADLHHLVGHGAKLMLGEAFARTGARPAADRLPPLIDSFIAHYREHLTDGSQPFPHVEPVLIKLKSEGACMGVLTNKPEELAAPLLRGLGLAEYFDAIHGAGRYSYAKPDPRVLRHILDALGAHHEDAIMIGDSATDVATARAAGIPVILLSYGYTPEPAHTLGADVVVDSFAEIPDAIRSLL